VPHNLNVELSDECLNDTDFAHLIWNSGSTSVRSERQWDSITFVTRFDSKACSAKVNHI
jgi:hypothetical protein